MKTFWWIVVIVAVALLLWFGLRDRGEAPTSPEVEEATTEAPAAGADTEGTVAEEAAKPDGTAAADAGKGL